MSYEEAKKRLETVASSDGFVVVRKECDDTRKRLQAWLENHELGLRVAVLFSNGKLTETVNRRYLGHYRKD